MSFLERKNTKDGMAAGQKASVDNIYMLDGKVPVLNAIPFGLQHILAMFVANIAPILIVAGACGMDAKNTAMIIQSAMMIAGIGTLIQLFPIWRIGSRLPIVMGISFTFVSIACVVGGQYGYGAIMGAVLVGGIVEGVLGLLSKYWMKLVTPIVAATVVTAIGFSLLEVGADSFGGGSSSADFGSATNWILGTVTLVCCIVFNIVAKSYFKQLSVLFGLIVGYIVALCMGVVDFSALSDTSLLALPHLMPFKMEFHADAIIAFVLIFLVSATETIGDTSALASSGLNRDVTQKETAGSLACDGFVSALSSVFGCMPITSFSQNVGLVAMNKVVNRFCIATGGIFLIACGLFPKLAALISIMPQSVLGGAAVMMFSSIVVSGIQLITKWPIGPRNVTIVSVALGLGYGLGSNTAILVHLPQAISLIFGGSGIVPAAVFAIILNIVLPKDEKSEIERAEEMLEKVKNK